MPFWKKRNDRPSKGEIESMQDAKISLTENLPAHTKIVDLSKIYLEHIPYGVVSVIKYQNKECLIVKENELKDFKGVNMELLSDLLKLDISRNLFKSVPKDFSHLSSLVHLNLDRNHLTTLPTVLGSLEKLQFLSAQENQIKTVAPEVGHLRFLTTLNLKDNSITKLPDSFAFCVSLTHLEMDLEKMVYPTGDVVTKGGKATVLWLCERNNVDPSKVLEHQELEVDTKLAGITEAERTAQEMVLRHQEEIEREQAELMKRLQEDELRFKKMANEENEKEEKHLKRLQQKLEEEDKKEFKRISDYLKFQDDVKAANIREALKDLEEKEYDASKLIADIEKMQAEEKENLMNFLKEDDMVFKKYLEENSLDMSFVAKEMQKVLEENRMMASFIKSSEKELQEMFKNVQEQNMIDTNLANHMQNEFEKDSNRLMKLIMEDEDLQKKMFITAQQEHDKIYRALNQEIESLQENLMLLTILEKSQKDMNEQGLLYISEQRNELAQTLTALMEKQEERRLELEATAKLIEEQHEDELANFWLYQYQMLMQSKPEKIKREEEDAIRAAMKAAEIESEYGGKGSDVYPTPSELPSAWSGGPSAPPAADASAPPESPTTGQSNVSKVIEAESECCICLDKSPNLAFLPCGHVCCCSDCGIVSICPMCRTEITGRIQLFFTQS